MVSQDFQTDVAVYVHLKSFLDHKTLFYKWCIQYYNICKKIINQCEHFPNVLSPKKGSLLIAY